MIQPENQENDIVESIVNDPVYPVFLLEDNNFIILVFPSLSFIRGNRIEVGLISVDKDVFLKLGSSGLVLITQEVFELLKEKRMLKIAVLPMGYDQEGTFITSNYGKVLDVKIQLSEEHLELIESYLMKTVQLQDLEPDFLDDKFLKLKKELLDKGLSEREAEEIAKRVFGEN